MGYLNREVQLPSGKKNLRKTGEMKETRRGGGGPFIHCNCKGGKGKLGEYDNERGDESREVKGGKLTLVQREKRDEGGGGKKPNQEGKDQGGD